MKENNYLKYYRDTLFYFRDNYSLKISDIEFLFFVYDLKYFTGTYIKNNYKCSMTFLTRNMPDLLKKIRGMFAFGLLDEEKNKFILA